MRKIMTILGAIMIFSFILTSCKTVQVPKYTTVDRIIRLKHNSSLESVISTLGIRPYDVLSSQVDGYDIYTFKYKLIEREVSPKIVNKRGGEIAGTEVYNGREQTLFLFFKSDELEAYVTTNGRKDSPSLVVLNNTLYSISKDREKFIFTPTKAEGSTDSGLPFLKKKKRRR